MLFLERETFPCAWTSSLFIEFEFHRASELQVWKHRAFKFFPFFKFKLKFGDVFSKFWPNFSSVSSFIEFEFAINTNHGARIWSSLKLKCLNLSSFWVSGSLFKHQHFQHLQEYLILMFFNLKQIVLCCSDVKKKCLGHIVEKTAHARRILKKALYTVTGSPFSDKKEKKGPILQEKGDIFKSVRHINCENKP